MIEKNQNKCRSEIQLSTMFILFKTKVTFLFNLQVLKFKKNGP